MKFICERDKLKDALATVTAQTKGGHVIPILSHVLIEASGRRVSLSGHDLDSCSRVSIDAEVSTEGSAALPGERLARLVNGLQSGQQVGVTLDEKRATIRAGRSNYSMSVLPAQDFPGMLEAKAKTTITLSKEQIARLFGVPESAISAEETRPYFHGIFLHVFEGKVSGCASDGHRLIRVSLPDVPAKFDGVIVPSHACAQILRIGKAECEIGIAENLVSLKCGDIQFTTKLIDATFPEFAHIIPRSATASMTFEAEVVSAALSRLEAVNDPKETRAPIARLHWGDNPESATFQSRNDSSGQGDEEVDCDCDEKPAGDVGFQIKYLREIIASLDCERITFKIDDPASPIKIVNPLDEHVVAVLMPCRV